MLRESRDRTSAKLTRATRGGEAAASPPPFLGRGLGSPFFGPVLLRPVLLIFVLLFARLLAGQALLDPGHPAAADALADRLADALDARGDRLANRGVLDRPLASDVVVGEREPVRAVRP